MKNYPRFARPLHMFSVLAVCATSTTPAWAQDQNQPPPVEQPQPQQQPQPYPQQPQPYPQQPQPYPQQPQPYPQQPQPYPQPYPQTGYGPPPPGYAPPGYQEHDGFFLRMLLGVGYLGTSTSDEGNDLSFSGVAGMFSLALGGAIAPNLILFGEVFANSITDPRYEVNGASETVKGIGVSVAGIGPGLAFYLPANVYLSGSVQFTWMTVDFDTSGDYVDDEVSTDFGLGVNAVIGKEWWVSRDWGMGIAGQLMLASMKDDVAVDPPTWNAAAFSLLFTASYN